MKELWKLPVKFNMCTEEDVERSESLGIPLPQKYEEGFIYLNPDHIVSINMAADGTSTLEYNGDRWSIMVGFDELINYINNKGISIVEF